MAPNKPARQISTLPFEQQERAIANKLPGSVNPQTARTDKLWCGHPTSAIVKADPATGALLTEEQAKTRSDAIEVCGTCSAQQPEVDFDTDGGR